MKFSRTIKTAFASLRQNALRATLTILGIVIGIASVIAMAEIGNGSAKAISQTISSMGANNIIVLPGSAASGGVSYGAGSVMTLTAEDAEAIGRELPSVVAVAPIVRLRAQVIFGNKNWIPQYVQGTSPDFLEVRDWKNLTAGRMFDDRDVRNANRVCVVGQTIVRELFGDREPLGEELRVQNVPFTIVGILGSKGANMMGMDQDDIILTPWTTLKYRVSGSSSSSTTAAASGTPSADDRYPTTSVSFYPPPSTSESESFLSRRLANVDQILVAAGSSSTIASAMEEIRSLLRSRHKIRPGEAEDFNMRDMAEMTKALTATSGVMTRLLLFVSLISLVVGGVGIMNIMLVSVTERTREIGLRMALGARERDIRGQFLIEAVTLCLIGGAIGVLLGRGCSLLVRLLLKWPAEASWAAIFTAIGVSASVGVIFGYYPARRASKLDPIEALRYE